VDDVAEDSGAQQFLVELGELWPALDAIGRVLIIYEIIRRAWGNMSKKKKWGMLTFVGLAGLGLVLIFVASVEAAGNAGEMARLGWAFLAGALVMLAVFLLSKI
jgi:hypothetical protein